MNIENTLNVIVMRLFVVSVLLFGAWVWAIGNGPMTKEESYRHFAKKLAVQDWSQNVSKAEYKRVLKAPLDQLLKEMGIKSSQLRGKLITNLVTTQAQVDQLNSLVNGTREQRNQVFNELLGKTMIAVYRLRPDSFNSSVVKNVSNDGMGTAVNVVGTASSMVGALQGGDTKGALEHLANGLNNAVMTSKVASAMVEYAINRTQLEIDMWKANEMEDAYQAYKNGSDGKNGYDIDQGDFTQLLTQMKGVYQRYVSDGIKEYAQKRGMSVHDIDQNKKLRDKIIKDLEQRLKTQFDSRVKADSIIDKKSDQYEQLIREMEGKDLLNPYDSVAKSYFNPDDSFEFRLTRLFNVRDSIIAMIGNEKASKLSDREMAGLIKLWLLSKRDGTSFEDQLRKRNLTQPAVVHEGEAGWVLVDTILENKNEELKRKNKSYQGTYVWSQKVNKGAVTSTKKYVGPTKKTHSSDMVKGESYSTTLSLSGLPDVIEPDETVTVTMNAAISHNLSYFSASASALLQVFSINDQGKKSGGTTNCYSKDRTLQVKAWGNTGGKEDLLSNSLDVQFNLGKGASSQRKVVQFATNGALSAYIRYVYEYRPEP